VDEARADHDRDSRARLQEDAVERAAAFHDRRLRELEQYDLSLRETLGALFKMSTKEDLSHFRLLRQPMAYQVLVVVWAASRLFGATDPTSSNDWAEITTYSLAKELSVDDESLNRTTNYVSRVVYAAASFGLIWVKPSSSRNKNLLQGTDVLHKLMMDFARRSAEAEDRDDAQAN
jgi:hypothetical protein